MSAQERREDVLVAAMAEFAWGGYAGTSTEAIAARCGISQPYLFRLFPSKQALFVAAVERGFATVAARFEEAAAGLEGEAALEAMGLAYDELLRNRKLIVLQLHAYAACSVPEIGAAVRAGFARVVEAVAAASGLPVERLPSFFATGMLCTVVAALGYGGIEELFGGTGLAGSTPAGLLAEPVDRPRGG